MSRQKECAPTVESQGANGMQPPRMITRFCDSWGITPRTLLLDLAATPFVLAALYVMLLGICAIDGAIHA